MTRLSRQDFPSPFRVEHPATAEDLAAVYLRWAGFPDADRTPTGADAGLDVVARRTLAQVKFKVGTTGRPDLQRLFGAAAHAPERQLCFFSLSQYSDGARTYAAQHGIALFGYDRQGQVWPCNGHAGELHRSAVARHAAQARQERERDAERRAQAAEAERLARADEARRRAEAEERARRRAAAAQARRASWSRRRAAWATTLERRRARRREARSAKPALAVRWSGAPLAVGFGLAVCGMVFGALGWLVEVAELLVPGGQSFGTALGGVAFYGAILCSAVLAALWTRRRRAARRDRPVAPASPAP